MTADGHWNRERDDPAESLDLQYRYFIDAELRSIAGATTCTCFTRHRQASERTSRPGVYRVGTLAANGERSASTEPRHSACGAAILDPFSLGSARKGSAKPLQK